MFLHLFLLVVLVGVPLPATPSPEPQLFESELEEVENVLVAGGDDSFGLEYTPKIQQLVDVVRATLREMGDLAFEEDQGHTGKRIVSILQGQIMNAVHVLREWLAFTQRTQRKGNRVKRDLSPGQMAHNQVGAILVGAGDKIAKDVAKLSGPTQEKIAGAHAKGLSQCDADPCKDARAVKSKVKGAMRQG